MEEVYEEKKAFATVSSCAKLIPKVSTASHGKVDESNYDDERRQWTCCYVPLTVGKRLIVIWYSRTNWSCQPPLDKVCRHNKKRLLKAASVSAYLQFVRGMTQFVLSTLVVATTNIPPAAAAATSHVVKVSLCSRSTYSANNCWLAATILCRNKASRGLWRVRTGSM